MTAGHTEGFALEPASASDFEALLALRLRAMRESLERLGRYDEQRARERLADGFDAAQTQHIVVDGRRVGFMVLKRFQRALRLDHLYIDPTFQRRGIGDAVLRAVCAQADAAQLPIEVLALKQSAANRFYLRHAFVPNGEGDWDIDYTRTPRPPGLQTVRAMWSAFEARDWAAARALMRTDLKATWWTSGERFDHADAFIAAQREYPEGWTIRLIECERLEDGRVMSVVRVDHPPAVYYATSFFHIQNGLIVAVGEYWATAEAPPAWRTKERIAGLSHFDALDDPRALPP